MPEIVEDVPTLGGDENIVAIPALGGVEKVEWPELVGIDVQAAVRVIEAERPDLIVVNPVRDGSIVSMDFAVRRVRVFYSVETGKVVRTPRIG